MQADFEQPESEGLMDDESFDEEARLASEGRWEELGLDPLPEGWQPATINDLKAASEP